MSSPEKTNQLANGFAQFMSEWAKDTNEKTQETLKEIAYQLSDSVLNGHVCLTIDPSQKDILLNSGVVGTSKDPQNFPLVLDEAHRLYLHRYFDYENKLAKRLCELNTPLKLDVKKAKKNLNQFFDSKGIDWQKIAAALALRQRLTIISGGPGTGKTTTVAKILACLIQENPDLKIKMAAPTGKAAARMIEALQNQIGNFSEDLVKAMPKDPLTIHRLLGTTSYGTFWHHKENPLDLDVLVVDEASMIDLALATRLIEAIPEHARLILLGDKDQLSAVEAGSVFSEISANPALSKECMAELEKMTECELPLREDLKTLKDSTVWLTQNYRFKENSGIAQLAGAIREKNVQEAQKILNHSDDQSAFYYDPLSEKETIFQKIQEGYQPFIDALLKDPYEKEAIFNAFQTFRVLCATREGFYGVNRTNEFLTNYLRSSLKVEANEWYLGRPVMITQNDYALMLFNGDIGITLPNEKGELAVYFPRADNTYRAFSPVRLPEHETTFAMTIHKSQGSEFNRVYLLIPTQENPVVTRELLYTGVTRAKEEVTLVCTQEMLKNGIEKSVQKNSGLTARILEHTRPFSLA